MVYKEIFLVDDDQLVNTINTFLFKKMGVGHKVQSFLNPEEALDRLKSFTDNEEKILVLLDINMPEMSGFEFLESMAAENFPTSVEVIILTSSDSKADKEEAEKHTKYVKDFISKPLREHMIRPYLQLN
jgi:CheY-like chemotaxis protein